LELVKALASLGADVGVPTTEGATSLFMAAQNGYVEVVKTLASLGEDVKARRKDAPLRFSLQRGGGTWRW
jgi:ankyrin repeat protein